MYHIQFVRSGSSEEMIVTVDGIIMEDKIISLKDDGLDHAGVVKF
jgi:hypothetical protein